MKKTVSIAIIAIMIMCSCIVPQSALADTISGTNASWEEFYVTVTQPGGSFTLYSYQGIATVFQHSFYGRSTGTGNESAYGFYYISVTGNGVSELIRWAPSATTNKSEVTTCVNYTLRFQRPGTYKILVAPMSDADAAYYWRTDSIHHWEARATWTAVANCGAVLSKY